MSEYLVFLQESPHDAHAEIAAEQIKAIRKDVSAK